VPAECIEDRPDLAECTEDLPVPVDRAECNEGPVRAECIDEAADFFDEGIDGPVRAECIDEAADFEERKAVVKGPAIALSLSEDLLLKED
jgi:hypothetical protein